MKIGQVIKLSNVRSVMTEPGKEIYNHGTTDSQLKLAWQTEITGDSYEFEPVYTKLFALKTLRFTRTWFSNRIPLESNNALLHAQGFSNSERIEISTLVGEYSKNLFRFSTRVDGSVTSRKLKKHRGNLPKSTNLLTEFLELTPFWGASL